MSFALLQFRNCFIIRFQSHCLTWDESTEELVLKGNVNKSMPFDRDLWLLDMQPNGTFTIKSCSNNEKSLSNNDNTLVCGDFSWDDCQLWRRESKFIKSEKTHGYLGIYIPEVMNMWTYKYLPLIVWVMMVFQNQSNV